MNATLLKLIKPIASLKLTVALLAMSIMLIFAATWEQIDYGIWTIVEKYFRSFFVWIRFSIFLPRDSQVGGGFPWPGGYLIGPLLLVNLLAAHSLRFKMKALGLRRLLAIVGIVASSLLIFWFHRSGAVENIFSYRGDFALLFVGILVYMPMLACVYLLFVNRAGIVLIHVSIIMLLVGELVTGMTALETRMPIYEGETIRYSQDIREFELAIAEPQSTDTQRVVSLPQGLLEDASGTDLLISNEALPFEVRVDQFMGNSQIHRLGRSETPQATHGFGRLYHVHETGEISGVATQQTADMPSAIVTLQREGQSIGTYMLSPWLMDFKMKPMGQAVNIDGKTYELSLRPRRYYKPYAMKLIDFSHDTYTGTNIPKNYSSQVHLTDPTQNQDRDILISMNRPLRYHGETFFQASFLPGDVGTILQVVSNPARHLPYIACAIGGVGLIFHFSLHLTGFLKRKRV